MARLLAGRECPNLMRVRDPVSGTAVGLLYRLPTTAERVAYLGGVLRREGESCVSALLECRRSFGQAVLCGLAEGDFELPEQGTNERRPLSSDPASPGFEPRWKELISELAPELVEALAYHVFEGHYASGNASGDCSGHPVVGEASKKK